jgi:hypothetical protein
MHARILPRELDMKRRTENYSAAATAAGLLALAVMLGIICAVILAAFRGAQWLVSTVSGVLV